MKHKTILKRVLCAILTVILLFVSVSAVASAVIFRVIYPRSSGYDTFTMSYDDIDPSEYHTETLSFMSGNNLLTGMLFTRSSPSALVVICSGMGDGARAHLSEAMAFTDMGYDVLCYDATGVGDSEGGGVIGLSQPYLDLIAAIDHIKTDETLGRLPLLLYAHSSGGWGAAVSCADDPHVKAAVIMAAFDSPLSLMYRSAKERVGLLADIEYPFLVFENNRIFREAADISAAEKLKGCNKPVMLIQGDSDTIIPKGLRLSDQAESIDNPLITTKTVYGGGHSGLWLSDSAKKYRAGYSGSAPDRILANDLNAGFMKDIREFFSIAVEA